MLEGWYFRLSGNTIVLVDMTGRKKAQKEGKCQPVRADGATEGAVGPVPLGGGRGEPFGSGPSGGQGSTP